MSTFTAMTTLRDKTKAEALGEAASAFLLLIKTMDPPKPCFSITL